MARLSISWLRKLAATLRGKRLEDDLDDELAFHIAQRTDALIASGLAPEEARRQARLAFGNSARARESTRDRNILIWLETALQDLRFAARTLRLNPGFAVTAILSLALGIGANTALFSILDTLLLRLLPVHEPDRLVRISTVRPASVNQSLSYPLLDRLRREATCFSGAFGMASFAQQFEENGQSVPVVLEAVTGEYFDVLGITASRGRTFHLADSGYTAESVAVISDSFWRSHYGAKDDALGRRLRVGNRENAREYTITGIAPSGYRGARIDAPADVWVPVEQAIAPQEDRRKSSTWGWLVLFARLAPGVTESAAKAEADAILHRDLEALAGQTHFDHPQQRDLLFSWRIAFEPAANGISGLRDRYSKPLLVIAAIAAMVLLIACANLANLLLARSTAREREISVRQALGAGRARLTRQLLVESLLISILGAAAALVIAYWLSRGMLRFLPRDLAAALPVLSFRLDARELAFTAMLAIFTCLLFGLLPALRATRAPAARIATHSISLTVSQAWTSRALVAAEIALCTLLLTTCGLFVRTLHNLRTLDAGFVREQILLTTVQPPRADSAERDSARFEELRARVATLPDVRGVGYSQFGLMIGDRMTADVDAEGRAAAAGEPLGATDVRISPGYLSAMGTPLLAGRDFTDRDTFGSPLVGLVNEAFAKQFFGGANPVGKHFGLDGPKSALTIEIVGLVRDVKYQNLRETPASIFYRPYGQIRRDRGMVLAVRSAGDLNALAATLRALTQSIDPNLTLRNTTPFAQLIDRSLLAERMVSSFSVALGLLALLVACVGLYGVLAYRVARRTREIGVRMALGASAGGVLRMILGESFAIFLLGVALGVPLSLALTRLIASLLFGLAPHDVATLVVTLAVLAIASFAAAWLPARRAARVDPMTALRCE
jgi:predicted permease